jgi:hypothetical protein
VQTRIRANRITLFDGFTSREVVETRSLVHPSQSPLVVLAPVWVVGSNVLSVAHGQLLDRFLNGPDWILNHGNEKGGNRHSRRRNCVLPCGINMKYIANG